MQEHVLAEGLKELGWFSLEKGRLCGEITAAPTSAHEEAVKDTGSQTLHCCAWWVERLWA